MNFLGTLKAVLWSFIGIRKRSGLEEDIGKLNPFAIIVVALVVVALFVTGLITLVHFVTAK